MPGLQQVARSVVLALVLMVLLVTAWVCLIAGLVRMLADTAGPGPALLWVGGGLVALVVLTLGTAAIVAGRERDRKTGTGAAKGAAGLLRGVVTVAGLPAGPRLLLVSASVFFALLAILALLLATRRTGTASPDRLPPR
jgi:hypothetical protein